MKILNGNLNGVIAVGHTDSSGTEDYNISLGAKRASAVISQLRRQLATLRPNAHRNIFWQTDSRGEAEPVSQNDPAANRRVEVCLRRINISE
jgi:OOP family OmpA-OmpF porin